MKLLTYFCESRVVFQAFVTPNSGSVGEGIEDKKFTKRSSNMDSQINSPSCLLRNLAFEWK